ncbi:MAG: penicillin-binding transpeptidase domain-containing protein [Patescibacteria group bacterium]
MVWWRLNGGRRGSEINPEDIFLDSSNLPSLDRGQFEGRVERPVSHKAFLALGGVFALVMLIFVGRAFMLQILAGEAYTDISRNNRLERSVLFATRGIVTDRNGTEIAWNELETDTAATSSRPFPARRYIKREGFAHLLGFVRYPKTDAAGKWWSEEYVGISGVEHAFDELLRGVNGSQMTEIDARGELVREDIIDPPVDGGALKLSIDADVQAELARTLQRHAEVHEFQGGAAAIMDVRTGELLALTSFPEYDNQAFSEGDAETVVAANTNPLTPLLNRAVAGLYAPGSIVKPLLAAAALNEDLIDPEKEILSTGSISIPNPYDPSKPSIFKDWKAHGWVDVRRALAVSSDVYFYTIGGGFEDQRGLGIEKIDEYARRFGLSVPTGIVLGGESVGTIPTPEWKREVFDDEWRLGDTYNTAIGQYGFQVTPLQVVRYAAALASGQLLVPQLVAGARFVAAPLGISEGDLQVVREGMRAAVDGGGTAAALYMPGISIAGKTGTAQVGKRNEYMNSWVIGFWPSDAPRYAFAVVLEKAPAGTLSGASPAMQPFFSWLVANKPEYVE